MAGDPAPVGTGAEAERDDAATAGADRPGAAAGDDDADREGPVEVVRSEEEVEVSTRVKPRAERVRLRKVVVEDEVTRTVPIRKEVVQLETDPPPEGTIESVEDVDDNQRP
jgi:hypothetical protein